MTFKIYTRSRWKVMMESSMEEDGKFHRWKVIPSFPNLNHLRIYLTVTDPGFAGKGDEWQKLEAPQHWGLEFEEGVSSSVFRISKRGPNFCWSLVLTQRGGGGQTKFSNFLVCTKFFFAKGGPWPNGPPKYASGVSPPHYGVGSGEGMDIVVESYKCRFHFLVAIASHAKPGSSHVISHISWAMSGVMPAAVMPCQKLCRTFFSKHYYFIDYIYRTENKCHEMISIWIIN